MWSQQGLNLCPPDYEAYQTYYQLFSISVILLYFNELNF